MKERQKMQYELLTITTQSIETHLLYVNLHSVFVLVAHIICRRGKQNHNNNKIKKKRR